MKKTLSWTIGVWLLMVFSALAAEEALPAAEAMSLAEIIRMGGWLMYVLGVLSVLGFALIMYYLL